MTLSLLRGVCCHATLSCPVRCTESLCLVADALRIPSVWLTAYATLTSSAASDGAHIDTHTYALLASVAAHVRTRTPQLDPATHAHPFKFLDYFAGVGKDAHSVSSVDEALKLLEERSQPRPPAAIEPRFTLAELHKMALRFVRAFPIRRVAASCTDV